MHKVQCGLCLGAGRVGVRASCLSVCGIKSKQEEKTRHGAMLLCPLARFQDSSGPQNPVRRVQNQGISDTSLTVYCWDYAVSCSENYTVPTTSKSITPTLPQSWRQEMRDASAELCLAHGQERDSSLGLASSIKNRSSRDASR